MKEKLKFTGSLILNMCDGDDIIDGFEGLFNFILMIIRIIGVLLTPLLWFLLGFYELGFYFFSYKKKIRKDLPMKHIRKNAESVHKSHFHPCWGIWLSNYLACRYCAKFLKELEKEELQKE